MPFDFQLVEFELKLRKLFIYLFILLLFAVTQSYIIKCNQNMHYNNTFYPCIISVYDEVNDAVTR